jgi:type I protein arginine methyltransferase
MHFYDFNGYCQMTHDEKRMKGFTEALKKFITPETIVLEIGAGTGVFTYLACKYGAKKVIAIEPNPVIQVAKEAINAHGFADRVEFLEKMSTDIDLPEKADLLLCDLHGNLPFFEKGIATIIDARERLLKDNAVFMPSREKVFLAAVNCAEAYESTITKNLKYNDEYTIPSAKRLLTNQILNLVDKDQRLVSNSQVFAELDYKTIESANAHAKVRLDITEKSAVHGIRAWFVAEHGEGFFVDNSIDTPKATYGQPMFPFSEPVNVDVNDFIEFDLNATLENGNYVFSWNTKIFEKTGELKHHFLQTTLANRLKSARSLEKQSEYFIPNLSFEASINKFIMDSCDGERMNGDIADLIVEKFPEKFSTFDEALARVTEVINHLTD